MQCSVTANHDYALLITCVQVIVAEQLYTSSPEQLLDLIIILLYRLDGLQVLSGLVRRKSKPIS